MLLKLCIYITKLKVRCFVSEHDGHDTCQQNLISEHVMTKLCLEI